MAKLLYSAIGKDGAKTQGFVDAASAQDARARLEAQGLREVQLHQGTSTPTEIDVAALSATQQADLARLHLELAASPTLATALRGAWRNQWWWNLSGVLATGVAFWHGAVGWGVALAVLTLLPFLLVAWAWRISGRYLAMIRAFSLGQWANARALIGTLRSVAADKPQMAFDLAVREALIDLVEHRPLADVLAKLETQRPLVAASPGHYDVRVAVLHFHAGDVDGYIRAMHRALAQNPSDPSTQLDYAVAMARAGRSDEAQAAFEKIDLALVPPHGLGFIEWVRGRLLLNRGEAGAAEALKRSVAAFLTLREQPAVWTALAVATGDYALALHREGHSDEARRQLAHVWPILCAHGQPALLAILKREGLAPAVAT